MFKRKVLFSNLLGILLDRAQAQKAAGSHARIRHSGFQRMKTVLVTLANSSYLNAARQLFSSAHFAGGWRGDYLLLASGVEKKEVEDFVAMGIHVRSVDHVGDDSLSERYRVGLGKVEVFSTYFQKWDRVLYLDADTIVRARLEPSVLKPKFGAVRDVLSLKSQLDQSTGAAGFTNTRTFNAGMLSFDTKVLKEDTYSAILEGILNQWRSRGLVDQPGVNIYFHDVWTPLPIEYNVIANFPIFGHVWTETYRGRIIHFTNHPKPWEMESSARQEWESNLKRFSEMDLESRQKGRTWTRSQAFWNRVILNLRFRLALTDVKVGETAETLRTILRLHLS
jgi:hypothetical protein